MQGRDMMRQREVSQVHQAGDRQPALNSGRALQGGWCAARLKLTNPEIEDAAEPGVQQQEPSLEAVAQDLRTVAIGAADELPFRVGRWLPAWFNHRRPRN